MQPEFAAAPHPDPLPIASKRWGEGIRQRSCRMRGKGCKFGGCGRGSNRSSLSSRKRAGQGSVRIRDLSHEATRKDPGSARAFRALRPGNGVREMRWGEGDSQSMRMPGRRSMSSMRSVRAHTKASRRSGLRPLKRPSAPKLHIWSSSAWKVPAWMTRPSA